MNDAHLCDCTVHCPGRQHCEIGTWVEPDPIHALALANEALQDLGEWLYAEPHTTREIVAAIFRSTPFAENPSKIDLFSEFFRSLEGLGFQSTNGVDSSAIWSRNSNELDGEGSRKSPSEINPHGDYLIWMGNRLPFEMPFGFQRVLEFLVLMNYKFPMTGDHRTSEIAEAFFPGVTKEILDAWLIEALDDCLYRVGYAPGTPDGDDKAGVFDDPAWSCDGDAHNFLKHNLWRGAPDSSPVN